MSSMLDPEVPPSQTKEMIRTGKGCLAAFVAAVVLIVGGYLVWDKTSTFLSTFGEIPDYPGPGNAKILVDVPGGASLDVIGGILIDEDVVKSRKAWDRAVRGEERATTVQAGRYLMKTQMKAIDALRLLINPGSSKIRLQFTIPEGLRLSDQVDLLSKRTKIKKSAYQSVLAKPKSLRLPKYAKKRPEGFLFPDTYELTADSSAMSTLKQMVGQYKSVTREIEFEAAAKKLKRSPYEVLIVASIIEREVNKEEYRAKVARVLYNRLDKGMKLSLDSTVIYAENLKTNTTTKKDQLASPSTTPTATRVCRLVRYRRPARPRSRPPRTRTRASGSTSLRSTSIPARRSLPRTRRTSRRSGWSSRPGARPIPAAVTPELELLNGLRRCAVLGSPIKHSLSPALHRAAYAHLGLNWIYDRVEVDAEGLTSWVDGLDASWRGLSLTMPLKVAVLGLGELDQIARLGGRQHLDLGGGLATGLQHRCRWLDLGSWTGRCNAAVAREHLGRGSDREGRPRRRGPARRTAREPGGTYAIPCRTPAGAEPRSRCRS